MNTQMTHRPDPRRRANRYNGAYGRVGNPDAGVLPGDYRVPGTSLTPHQWSQELRRRLRDGLDLAGQPLHAYAIYSARHAIMGSRPTHRGAARFAARLGVDYYVRDNETTT